MGSRVQRFEDLIARQKAREARKEIVRLIKEGKFRQDWDLINQIRSAATSTMANVAEGFERTGPREFCHFLSNAKASCAEVRSHLYAALDSEYLTPQEFDIAIAKSDEAGRVIGGLKAAIERRNASEQDDQDAS